MSWARLDDRMHQHRKIIAMSDRAYRLFMYSITYASAHNLKGRLTPGDVQVLFRLVHASKRHDAELVALNAWEEEGEDRIIHDFSEYNPSRDELHEKRAEAGKKGASSRWQNGKPMASASDGKMANDDSRAHPLPLPLPDPDPVPNPKGKRQGGATPRGRFAPPTPAEAEEEFARHGMGGQKLGEKFIAHYAQSGWKLKGGNAMRDWRAAIQNWALRQSETAARTLPPNGTHAAHSIGRTLEDQYNIEAEAIARLGL